IGPHEIWATKVIWVPCPVHFGVGDSRREPPRQRPASTRTAARAFRQGLRKASGLSLMLVGSQARQPRLPGVSPVGWRRQRRVCPRATTPRETPRKNEKAGNSPKGHLRVL